MGVACALAGRFPDHNRAPVLVSNALNLRSTVPPTKVRPPAVEIDPPRLMEPYSSRSRAGDNSSIVPRGTRHRMARLARSTAISSPQGGGAHGIPDGAKNGDRAMAKGVPSCGATSPLKFALAAAV